eukprot:CAMPEP_0119349468 /NCGR_PEP_ID=MMETSP1333-20130426/109566_1 /TAXON_ID=418940 /ORGANISM="Scyphosphaera apsteinii, Strain RCC1455" /LENGTH=529 /DNA_ID=CAMNT_0007362065 /DNA_START=52 /DNA_END=1641 /DNA_ORIENTATION=-
MLRQAAFMLSVMTLMDGFGLFMFASAALDLFRPFRSWIVLSLQDKATSLAITAKLLISLILLCFLLRLKSTLQALLPAEPLSIVTKWNSRAQLFALCVFGASTCLAAAGRSDVDVPLFALALYALTEVGEATARGWVLSALANKPQAWETFVARPEFLQGGSSKENALECNRLSEALKGQLLDKETVKQLSSLDPQLRRQPGGLVCVLLILPLTSVVDVSTAWAQLGTWQQAETWEAAMHMIPVALARIELITRLIKLSLKGCFTVCSFRLRAHSRPQLLEFGRATPPWSSIALAALSGMLLLSSTFTASLPGLISSNPGLTVNRTISFNSTIRTVDHSEAVASNWCCDDWDFPLRLSGPIAILAVAGYAIALGSAGRRSAALLCLLAFLGSATGAVWLCFGPLGLRDTQMIELLLSKHQLSQRWEHVSSDILLMAAVFSFVQVPLLLVLALTALAHFACGYDSSHSLAHGERPLQRLSTDSHQHEQFRGTAAHPPTSAHSAVGQLVSSNTSNHSGYKAQSSSCLKSEV